jgi:hypothetical protein
MMNNEFLIKQFRKAYHTKGYKLFEKGDYNLNSGGIRSKIRIANSFDDLRFHFYKVNDMWNFFFIRQTTDPGITGLKKPCRPQGCAILVPGQYSYKIGEHKGRPALVQNGKVKVYRDWNKDNILDMDPGSIEEDYFGINVHDVKSESEFVDGRSLGCQVNKYIEEHRVFMRICNIAAQTWGKKITYTLLDEVDFD